MRLSKTRKEELSIYANNSLSVLTGSIRKERKAFNRIKFTIVQDETVRLNPKKVKSARRARNPLPHDGLIIRKPGTNKYPYNPLITKRTPC